MRHSVATPLYLFKRALDRLFAAFTSRQGTPRLSSPPALPIVDEGHTNGSADPDALPSPVDARTHADPYDQPPPEPEDSTLRALAHTPFPTASPHGWVPLYTMVTFRPDVGYAAARAKAAYQQRVLAGLGWGACAAGAAGLALAAARLAHRLRLLPGGIGSAS